MPVSCSAFGTTFHHLPLLLLLRQLLPVLDPTGAMGDRVVLGSVEIGE